MPTWLKFCVFGVLPFAFMVRHILKIIRTGIAPSDAFGPLVKIHRSERLVRFWIEVCGGSAIGIGWLLLIAYALYFDPQP